MTSRIHNLADLRWSLSLATVICFALFLLSMGTRQATAQAVPAATWPAGDTNPADQPLPGQQLGTNLTLNQGVQAINAENQSFERYGLGLEASGGAETNFFGTETNKVTAGYAQFSASAGLRLATNRTRYFALYQPQYNVYPQYSEVNNFSQQFYQNLTHTFSDRTGIAWDLTAARYLSVNQFLPPILGIGGVGVIVPTVGNQLLQNSLEDTNAATVVRLRYLMNERMTFTGTLTASYFLLVPSELARPSGAYTERFITSGADFRLDYQLTRRDTIGAALTPIYIYGLSPAGHELAEIVQATYQRQLTQTLNVSAGAGPLFIQSSSPQYGSTHDTSYAINAALSRQVRQSQFSLSYNRAFVVNLLSPTIVSDSAGFSTYYPMKRKWILIGTATYSHQRGNAAYGSATIYGGSGQMAYQVGSKAQIYAQYSLLSESFNRQLLVQPFAFTRNQFGGGIRFNLGNASTRGGVH